MATTELFLEAAESAPADAISFVASVLQAQLGSERLWQGSGMQVALQPSANVLRLVVKVRGADGVAQSVEEFTEANTILRALVHAFAGSDRLALSSWLGGTALEQAQVAQWLSFAHGGLDSDALAALDNHLGRSSFLVSFCPSLADIALYWAVHAQVGGRDPSATQASLGNLCRWFDQMQHGAPVAQSPLAPTKLTFQRVLTTAAVGGALPAKKMAGLDGVDKHAMKKAKKEAKKKEKKEKKEKKGKKPEAPAAAVPPISLLDIRVGEIKRAWRHEESEKLYCEEIDLGEEKPRMIASGLVKAYTSAEEVMANGKRVVVLCNLKPRNMVGFSSHGMVMCASSVVKEEGETPKVELLAAPEGAAVGERITLSGLDVAEPAPPNAVAKKKLFEKSAPNLRTDENGVACWIDPESGVKYAFTTTAGTVKAPSVVGGTVA